MIFNEKATVFGNLPYNISTEILSKWILNLKNIFWFDSLVLMFQKEVADRIIAKINTSNYGRLSIISNWKLNIKKICDIKPEAFSPKPKIDSSLLFFYPKKNFLKIKNPNNLEKVTRIFFNQRRKMLKKPFNQLFNGDQRILEKLNIDLNKAKIKFNLLDSQRRNNKWNSKDYKLEFLLNEVNNSFRLFKKELSSNFKSMEN